jgi:hypothetical protein
MSCCLEDASCAATQNSSKSLQWSPPSVKSIQPIKHHIISLKSVLLLSALLRLGLACCLLLIINREKNIHFEFDSELTDLPLRHHFSANVQLFIRHFPHTLFPPFLCLNSVLRPRGRMQRTKFQVERQTVTCACIHKKNLLGLSPLANYTDRDRRLLAKLVPTFVDRDVSRSQRGKSLTVVISVF